LIRISYGPFQLAQLKPGEVEEIRRKVMRDQLGMDVQEAETSTGTAPKKTVKRIQRRRNT
jgi:23S rRNA pseudouridine2605 synthase